MILFFLPLWMWLQLLYRKNMHFVENIIHNSFGNPFIWLDILQKKVFSPWESMNLRKLDLHMCIQKKLSLLATSNVCIASLENYWSSSSGFLIKSNGPYLQPSKSSHDPVVVMKFEFCAHSARLLRKLDHVLLWILSTNTGLWQCSICAE